MNGFNCNCSHIHMSEINGIPSNNKKGKKNTQNEKKYPKRNACLMLLSALNVHIEHTRQPTQVLWHGMYTLRTHTHATQSRPNKSGFNLKALDNYLGKMKMAM